MRLRCSAPIVKQLLRQLRLAWRCGDQGRIRRLAAMAGLAEARPVAELAERPGVCEGTIYAWPCAFLSIIDGSARRDPAGRLRALLIRRAGRHGR